MEKIYNADQAKDLLLDFLPPPQELYQDEHWLALLDAASLALRLLVDSSNVSEKSLSVYKMKYVQKHSWKKAKNRDFAEALVGHVNKKKPSVVGFHVIDPEIGRYSQIWIPPSRNCPLDRNVKLNNWWQAYPTLWLSVYKHLLHPSTSLLNAYSRKLLEFQQSSLLIQWNDNNKRKFNGTIVSLNEKCSEIKEFLSSTIMSLKRFHKIIIKNHLNHITVDRSEEEIRLATETISSELKEINLTDALEDTRTQYLYAIIKAGSPRNRFLDILEQLGGKNGDIFRQLNYERKKKIWYGETRQKAIEGIEILQTILFNSPGFCNKNGFLIYRKKIESTLVSIILGQEDSYKLDGERYLELFDFMIDAIKILRDDVTLYKPRRQWTQNSDHVVEETLKQFGHICDQDKFKFFKLFITFARKLSLEAIHEGQDLSFLLGFGHAEEPETRCRNPIRLHNHLSRVGVDLDLLVHFVKSYFSLFGQENRILWFNQHGRCHGLYERAPQDTKEKWLEKWNEDCYFVHIKGKGQLDILSKENGIQHRPRIRIKGDKVVNLKTLKDIRCRVIVAAAQVFSSNNARTHWLIQLITKVVDRLLELNHGAGLVIINECVVGDDDSKWRISIDDQAKPLVSELEGMTYIEEGFGNNDKEPREELVNEICSFAELDGAVSLVFKRDNMRVYPARHFVPLVKKVDQQKNNLQLLDFYKWTKEGMGNSDHFKALHKHLKEGLDTFKNVYSGESVESENNNLFTKCRNSPLNRFTNPEILKLYASSIMGLPKELIDLDDDDDVRKEIAKLSFLNSSGTRHHSLWGITLSTKEPLFAVSLSEDGRVSVFWDGRLIPSLII